MEVFHKDPPELSSYTCDDPEFMEEVKHDEPYSTFVAEIPMPDLKGDPEQEWEKIQRRLREDRLWSYLVNFAYHAGMKNVSDLLQKRTEVACLPKEEEMCDGSKNESWMEKWQNDFRWRLLNVIVYGASMEALTMLRDNYVNAEHWNTPNDLIDSDDDFLRTAYAELAGTLAAKKRNVTGGTRYSYMVTYNRMEDMVLKALYNKAFGEVKERPKNIIRPRISGAPRRLGL